MFKNINWLPYLKFGVLAAFVYCIPVTFFLRDAVFQDAWLLYSGNFLFIIVIVSFLFYFNNKRKQNAGTLAMLTAGFITTAIGILLACLFCFTLLLMFVPDILQPGLTGKLLERAPANTVEDKTSGLAFMIFANALIGNICAGTFVSIIFPFTLKGNQTREKEAGRQNEL